MAVGKSDLFCWRSHRRCNQWWIFRIRCRGGFVISWTFPERSMARSIFGFYCNSRTVFFLISLLQIPWVSDRALSGLLDPWSSDSAALYVFPGPGIYRPVGCFTCASKSATLCVVRDADCFGPFSVSACDSAWVLSVVILATSAIFSSILSQMSVFIVYNSDCRDAIAVNTAFSFRLDVSSPSG